MQNKAITMLKRSTYTLCDNYEQLMAAIGYVSLEADTINAKSVIEMISEIKKSFVSLEPQLEALQEKIYELS